MKKQALILFIIGLFLCLTYVNGKEAYAAKVIPDEAIRLRILANSDSKQDQALKRKIRDEVNRQIAVWVKDLKSFDEAKVVIKRKLPEIERIVSSELEKEHQTQAFKVEFKKANFPTKAYGDYIYPAGRYEAVLITLGDGDGANWWCVLFPPLCFLDFSNGEAVQKANDPAKNEIEVKFATWEWLKKVINEVKK